MSIQIDVDTAWRNSSLNELIDEIKSLKGQTEEQIEADTYKTALDVVKTYNKLTPEQRARLDKKDMNVIMLAISVVSAKHKPEPKDEPPRMPW